MRRRALRRTRAGREAALLRIHHLSAPGVRGHASLTNSDETGNPDHRRKAAFETICSV